LDGAGRILAISENVVSALGYAPEAVQGRLLADLQPAAAKGALPAFPGPLVGFLEIVRQHGHAGDQDLPILDHSRKVRTLRWRGWLLSEETARADEPRAAEVVLIAHDCTPPTPPRAAPEAADERGGQPLQQTARNVAHKLNNHLTTLLCRWDLLTLELGNRQSDERQLDEIKQMLEACAAQVQQLSRACLLRPEPREVNGSARNA
jgi:hypothetical protein